MIELVASGRLVEELRDALIMHPGIEQVVVSRLTLRNALTAALEARIQVDELVAWARLVELQADEVRYETGFQRDIATFIFRLATPEINPRISLELCKEMIRELEVASSSGPAV